MLKQRQGWVRNYSDLAKQRMQNKECPVCGKPKTEWTRRTSWTCCSKTCSEKFYEDGSQSIQSWATTRAQAFKRDDYSCVWCGKRFACIAKYPPHKGQEYADSSKLIGDHITPIAVGGAEFDLDNVQTLCIPCNKIKTKRDMQTIARFRKMKKAQKYDIDMMKVDFPKQEKLVID